MTQQMIENFQEHRSHGTQSSMQLKSVSSFNEAYLMRPKSVTNRFFGAHTPRSVASSALSSNRRCSRLETIERQQQQQNHQHQHHNSPPSRLRIKSAISEPWQKIHDGEQKTIIQTPNYILMKNNQSYSAILKNDLFKIPIDDTNPRLKSTENTKKSNLPAFIQDYIDKLVAQVDDLQVFLEEERLAHKNTRQQAQEYLKEQLLAQVNKYESLLQILKQEHAKDLENTRLRLLHEYNEEKVKFDLAEQKLKADLQLLQGSFHSYKVNIQADLETQFKIREQELVDKYETESKETLRQVQTKLSKEREKEKRDMIQKQMQELDEMRKRERERLEKEDLERIGSGFGAGEKQKLDSTLKELNECQMEIEELKQMNEDIEAKLKNITFLFNEKTQEYDLLKMNFDSKLKAIEDTFRDEIDNLIKDKSNITNLYMRKCEELYNERQLITGKLIEKAQMTKDMLKKKLINTRNNARVSIAASVPSNDDTKKPHQKTRRSSVPSTPIELIQAQLAAGSIENITSKIKLKKKHISN